MPRSRRCGSARWRASGANCLGISKQMAIFRQIRCKRPARSSAWEEDPLGTDRRRGGLWRRGGRRCAGRQGKRPAAGGTARVLGGELRLAARAAHRGRRQGRAALSAVHAGIAHDSPFLSPRPTPPHGRPPALDGPNHNPHAPPCPEGIAAMRRRRRAQCGRTGRVDDAWRGIGRRRARRAASGARGSRRAESSRSPSRLRPGDAACFPRSTLCESRCKAGLPPVGGRRPPARLAPGLPRANRQRRSKPPAARLAPARRPA